jgi:hypothetical protein
VIINGLKINQILSRIYSTYFYNLDYFNINPSIQWLYTLKSDLSLLLWGFLITHSTRHTVGLLSTSDQPVSEASTYTEQHNIRTQERNIHSPSGIQTRDSSKQAAAELRIRPCGHWDRRLKSICRLHLRSAVESKIEGPSRWNIGPEGGHPCFVQAPDNAQYPRQARTRVNTVLRVLASTKGLVFAQTGVERRISVSIALSSTPKMKVIRSAETSVTTYMSTASPPWWNEVLAEKSLRRWEGKIKMNLPPCRRKEGEEI